MIVIAIIGILAASLFPAMSGYLSRSRDTARIAHLWQIMTALWAYDADKETYSGVAIDTTPECLNSGAIAVYMNGNVPQDRATKTHCNASYPWVYGVGTGFVNWLSRSVVLSAVLENATMGNTGVVISSFQWTIPWTFNMLSISSYTKWYGSWYVMYR